MLYKSINKYQKWWVYIENKSKHNIGLLYFVDIKRTILHLITAYWVFLFTIPCLLVWFTVYFLRLAPDFSYCLVFLVCIFVFVFFFCFVTFFLNSSNLLYQIFLLLPYLLHLHNSSFRFSSSLPQWMIFIFNLIPLFRTFISFP